MFRHCPRAAAALAGLLLALSCACSGCANGGRAASFPPCEVALDNVGEPLPDDVAALLTGYFSLRGDSFGLAGGCRTAHTPAASPLALSQEVRDNEAARIPLLRALRTDWGCEFSAAQTDLRVDHAVLQGDVWILRVYEFAYFYNWYKKYTTPDTADRSGYGVRHVVRIRMRQGQPPLLEKDYYDEGRPTGAAAPGREGDEDYRAYAGLPSAAPAAVTGEPPALPAAVHPYPVGFDAAGAVAYAEQWAAGRNPAYRDFSRIGGDCCNFASQCLMEGGGMKTNDIWHPGRRDGVITVVKPGLAWISSTRLYAWLTGENGAGRGVAVIRYGDAAGRTARLGGEKVDAATLFRAGSPVFYRWSGGFLGDGKWSHTAVCVGTLGDGTPAVSCHTGDKYRMKWNYGGPACDYGTVQLTAE